MKQAVKRDDVDLSIMAKSLHQRCEVLGDIPAQLDFIDEMPEYDLELYTSKKMKTNPEVALDSLLKIKPVIEAVEDFTFDNIHTALFALIEQLGCKNGIILWPLRVAVSGKQFTPGGGIEIAATIGKEDTLKRIDMGIEKLKAALG